MKTNKKLIYVISAICISLGLIAFTMQKTVNQPVVALNNSDDYLKEKEQEIWHKFATIGITQAEFEKRCQEYKLQCSQNKPEASIISPAVKERLTEILRKLHLDINQFTLIHWDDNSPVAYSQNCIFINESRFNELPELAQSFAVAHEMQHMLFEDEISIAVMQDWTTERAAQYPQAREFFNAYSRFIEERADIMAAFISQEFAQGYITFFDTLLKKNGDNPGITHPKHSDRLQLAQQIYSNQQGALA